MATNTTPREVSRGDRWSLYFFATVGTITAAWSIIAAIWRIIEVLPNHSVEVLASFRGTPASAPIGPDGTPATVQLQEAVITVPSLPVASLWSIVIQQVLMAATVVTIVTCLILLIANLVRSRVFSRTNTRLVGATGLIAVLGYAAYPFFGNMAANGAFARLSEGTFENVVISVDLTTLFALGFAAALASTVFLVGERLQRDTEGLV
ncbi:MAG TPA: hypothetical protein PK781_06935 [Terrimesophilobacter sp.]|nr:hypothetical protein [Terrimesophilobacter sp.]HRQ00180.1 hypothetical protein [Terrimesophilobacter sp.]